MGLGWNYFFTLIWIAYMISSGILLFSRGFLLSRVSQQDTSSCRHLSEDINEEYYLNDEIVAEIFKDVNASSSLCLPKKSKVIILIIDALKYEFGVHKPNLSDPLPFENKLSIFNELLTAHPDRSRLLKFRADPPTTTLQRLKGLTTGSLPTFIDIGSNFATAEINEDNIIDQIIKSGLNTVFLGDSTWTELYPKRFKREYSYPSFDIFDLDSVDTEIEKNLPKELKQNDWDALIAHFLGVDHCGHRYGPFHDEMTRKLLQMDKVIRYIIKEMDNDTMLLVMGDHGMTGTGDHGGESEDEVNSLLFAYSPQHKFLVNEFGSDNTTMQQIDLVPTVAIILGVPIPYSNLGLLNFNIVPDVIVPHMLRHQGLTLHVWQNGKQIFNYFHNYAMQNTRTFDIEEMEYFENKFIELTFRVNTIYNEEAFKNFIIDLHAYLREILNLCRNIWVKFDANQMSQGLLFTFLPVFFAFLLINNSRVTELPKIFTWNTISFIYCLNVAAITFGYRYYRDLDMKTEEHGIIFTSSLLNTVILSFLTIRSWLDIALNWSHVKRFSNMPTRLIFILSSCVFFSNSFVVEEQKILSYLLAAILILLLYQVIYSSHRVEIKTKFKLSVIFKSLAFKMSIAVLLAIVILRFSYVLFRCREEQGNCIDFNINDTTRGAGGGGGGGSQKSNLYIATIITLGLYVSLTRIYLRSCGNLTGFQINVILARYGPTIGAICAGGHMLISNNRWRNIRMSHVDALAWVVYILFILQVLVICVSPLMLYVLPKKSRTITVNPYGKVIPEIFQKMKKIYEGGFKEENDDIPVVCGLATVYSSSLISFGVFLTLVLVILLDARAAVGIFICNFVAAVILVAHSILRYRTSKSLEHCLQPTFTAIIAWFLLTHFCFFATSHQTTMSQIDWRAAFVGRTANYDHSNFLSAILVILNTFCGQILFSLLSPLLSSMSFSIFALYGFASHKNVRKSSETADIRTTTINKNELGYVSDFDVTRGELILYENSGLFIGTLFKLAIQIFMLQGVRIFCAMMACTIHCRHLMVWKIFAPRFIYEGLATFVMFPFLILGYLIVLRVHWSVSSLVNKINKLK